jgi:hypothetical protein
MRLNPAAKENRMTEVIEATPTQDEVSESIAAPENPAIAHCMSVWSRAYKIAEKTGRSDIYIEHESGIAYRHAMPPLTGEENIRDFIACVAQGMLIGAIAGPDGARLLYAAQVAHTTVTKEGVTQKSAAK